VRGFFGIGIENGKTVENLGTLWRTAHAFGADFIFTIGGRYHHQPSDTTKAWRHIPLFHYTTPEDMFSHKPVEIETIGVEIHKAARNLMTFTHPERAMYVLGAEDKGLSPAMLSICSRLVQIPTSYCINVAVAGSILMYDRTAKRRAAHSMSISHATR